MNILMCLWHRNLTSYQVLHSSTHIETSFLQTATCVKTPIPCDVDFTKKEMHKLTFDSLEEDHSYKRLQLSKLKGPNLTAIVHREMDLPVFW